MSTTSEIEAEQRHKVPEVGDRITIQGTGRWWAGSYFSATVVDVRDSDKSVKVRYLDGGYKRLPLSDYHKLLGHGDDVNLNERAFGSKSYELGWEDYDPAVEARTAVDEMREELAKAVKTKDFKKAQELKLTIKCRLVAAEELKNAQAALLLAVEKEDFVEAQKLQGTIDQIKARHTKEGLTPPDKGVDFADIASKSFKRALGGGLAGAGAMAVQVSTLMWLRTTMNYQYRHGTSTAEALKALWKQGGIRRFYAGLTPALLQGPLSRFGDTAANTGMMTLMSSHPSLKDLPVGVKTIASSTVAAGFRIVLMPIDTIKTTMQVEGKEGWAMLMKKQKAHGPAVWFHGSLAASAATFAGHFPWFFTYNTLDARLPVPDGLLPKLGRNAFLGFCSSAVSDTVSNSIRVVKTYRQVSEKKISYMDTIKEVVDKDGLSGLFGRGLKTRIVANGIQGLMFSVMWKAIDEQMSQKS